MNHELPVKVTICQSILNKENMDNAVRSFTEMGVTDVIPVRVSRMYQQPIQENEFQKRLRWRSKELVRNSLRKVTPTIHDTIDFADAVKMIKDYDVAILAYENERDRLCTAKALAKCKNAKSIIIFIGSEWGYEPYEVKQAKDAGAHIVSLGKRIIRASNAGAILMGMLVYVVELGNENV